jgi:hypothetical protein
MPVLDERPTERKAWVHGLTPAMVSWVVAIAAQVAV